ncbi:LytR/AlgR family response regulator transcription factor, partial [Ideonella dechloratans]|uniref:LytR/AlgR family response regulator transcription factor n=1 Tax=Ideonella dechloratans TaxID=36863 RepID=UPI0035B05283
MTLPAPTALIAEDEPLLARALAAELQRAWPGLQLLPTAPDGEEAVAQALAAQPDLLFLDIRMPGQTGLEAAQAIVEDWPAERPLPLIVFVTAYD